ncbi:Hypothetical protein NTJ_05598 [Nesidiocoris tenuis]|uniref:Uncharacterized protein n=1 Tax=Nesidiocoris tenuis TaxID=355587 RepID=A0ABN7ANH8_9HEMI|nr:Hypothetical protein NTJ_05598 [Nesidiocoris tenuis]
MNPIRHSNGSSSLLFRHIIMPFSRKAITDSAVYREYGSNNLQSARVKNINSSVVPLFIGDGEAARPIGSFRAVKLPGLDVDIPPYTVYRYCISFTFRLIPVGTRRMVCGGYRHAQLELPLIPRSFPIPPSLRIRLNLHSCKERGKIPIEGKLLFSLEIHIDEYD